MAASSRAVVQMAGHLRGCLSCTSCSMRLAYLTAAEPDRQRGVEAYLHGVATANKDAIDAQLRQRRDAVVVFEHLLSPQRLHVEINLYEWDLPVRSVLTCCEVGRKR